MKVAIMQPYFFPYLGYLQLMQAVDCFVFYDDVQYIKRGWVNRNRVLLNGAASMLTYPVAGASQSKLINQCHYLGTSEAVEAVLGKVRSAYLKAPYFDEVYPLIAGFFDSAPTSVADFNRAHLVGLARALGLRCEFRVASELDATPESRGQERIVDLCQQLGAERYVNPIGGTSLYDPERFAAVGLELRFLRSRLRPYPQFAGEHVPSLSVIDCLMFNGLQGTAEFLDDYDLISAESAELV